MNRAARRRARREGTEPEPPLPAPVYIPAGQCPLCGQPKAKHRRLAASCMDLQRARMHMLNRTLGTDPRALRMRKPRTPPAEPRPKKVIVVSVKAPDGVHVEVNHDA